MTLDLDTVQPLLSGLFTKAPTQSHSNAQALLCHDPNQTGIKADAGRQWLSTSIFFKSPLTEADQKNKIKYHHSGPGSQIEAQFDRAV